MNELGWSPEQPTARGVAQAVRTAIREGVLIPGEKLPPIRSVARQPGPWPNTVSSAWGRLVRAGAIRTDGRRGTTVADIYTGTERYQRALEPQPRLFEQDLSTGIPDPALLPDLSRAFHSFTTARVPGGYLDSPVLPELVEQLRGDWPHKAQRFTVVDGAMDALEIATRSFVRFGDRVIVEDPCFPLLIDALESAGAEVIGVRSGSKGMLARPLAEALARPVAAIYLQPRAQNPTGGSLTPARARELADIIRHSACTIIEDDSTGHIATSPAISLGEWLPEQTIHIRSFSKSHGPDLRIAAMSGNEDAIREIEARRRLGQGWTSRVLQQLLLNMLTSEQAREAVTHARRTYHERRRNFIDALAAHGVRVESADGFNLWIPVANETSALVYLASHGIGAAAGAPFTVGRNPIDHIRVTISRIDVQCEELAAIVAAASKALHNRLGR